MRDKNRHFQSVAWLLIFGGCLIGGKVPAQDIDQDAVNRVFQFGDLESDRVQANRQYLPFLNVDSLHCGIYCLKAGAKDGQQPHTQDEIYYVETGVAKIQIEGKNYDLKKGSIVFVPAKAKHHFHSITEDLKTLVFFSKGPVATAGPETNRGRDDGLRRNIESSMTFEATFDSVTDANLSGGQGFIWTADSIARKSIKQHGHVDSTTIVKGEGVSGDCLRFSKKTKQVLFYRSGEAADLSPRPNWNGSVSFWLKLDPNKDLGDGFCDPIQIAGRKWNDGAIWVDFDNVKPRTFRLGVYSNTNFWNPKRIKWDQFPDNQKPQVTVNNPPFSADDWTHVAITFADINSTKNKQSNAKLYLNGELKGTIDRKIEISWDKENDPPGAIMLGLNYIGDFDELSVYNRELTQEEVAWLNRSIRQ